MRTFPAPSASQSKLEGGSARGADYHSMLERSAWHVLRKDLLNLFGYVFSVSPHFDVVHSVVTAIRLLQLCIPSLLAACTALWPRGTTESSAIAVVSIFGHLIPPASRLGVDAYITIFGVVLNGICCVACAVCAKSYRKNARLQHTISAVLSFYFASFAQVLHPLSIALCTEGLSHEIWQASDGINSETLGVFIAMVLVQGLFCYFFVTVVTQTLLFRPMSLMTILNEPQNGVFICTIAVTLFMGLAAHADKIPGAVLGFLTVILYIVCAVLPFIKGGFVSLTQSALVCSCSISSALIVLFLTVLRLMERSAALLYIPVFLIVHVAAYLIVAQLIRNWVQRELTTLDEILDSDEDCSSVNHPDEFLDLSVAGMRVGHPVCVNWTLFRYAVETWPREPDVWYVFAKFVAIYPEETPTLNWIQHTIVAEKLKGSTVSCVKRQAHILSRRRESNLSPELKSQLNSLSKHLLRTKHKLRHVWDVVIQGNIGEVESSSKRALEGIEHNDAEFKHLFRTFPNNRFVTRAYYRFLMEIRADRIGALEMLEKTRMLQHGFMVSADRAHELGLDAFPALPERRSVQQAEQREGESIMSISTEVETTEEEGTHTHDAIAALERRIEDLTIPAISRTRKLRFLAFIVVLLAPMVAFLIFSTFYIDGMMEPLPYIRDLSMTRAGVYQMAAFSLHFLKEQTNQTVLRRPTLAIPKHLGNLWSTKAHVIFIMAQTASALQSVVGLQNLNTGYEELEHVKSMLFLDTFDYTTYTQEENGSNVSMTTEKSVVDFLLRLAPISNANNISVIFENGTVDLWSDAPPDPSITPKFFTDPIVLNILKNLRTVVERLDEAMLLTDHYVEALNVDTGQIADIYLYCLLSVSIVVQTILLFLQLRWIRSAKEETYHCLTSLPKHVVSQLSENLRVLKKGGDGTETACDTELSKQEDNILKTFNNVGGGDSKLGDLMVLMAVALVSMGMTVGVSIVLSDMLRSCGSDVQENAPHLDSLLAAYSHTLGAYYYFEHLLIQNWTHAPRIWSPMWYVDQITERLDAGLVAWHRVRYGGTTEGGIPFARFGSVLHENVAAQDAKQCPNPQRIIITYTDARRCIPSDMAFVTFQPVMMSKILPFVEGRTDPEVLNETYNQDYISLWRSLISPLYDMLFMPMFESITPFIEDYTNSTILNTVVISVILVLVALASEIISYLQLESIDEHLRAVLELLLHVPIDVVTSVPKIVQTLAGDFTSSNREGAHRAAQFLNTVFESLPDAVMFGRIVDQKIEGANESCKALFGTEDIVGRQMKDFYNTDRFRGDVHALFAGRATKTLTLRTSDGTEAHYEVSSSHANEKLILSAQDITQTVRYNTLIATEQSKSDALLATILPPSLVKRVQAGEQNISFAVQSASISFIDIVEFTPWCGSLPAAVVMSTLNSLFKKFDECVAAQSTMTKIKCIGDCFMSAGGIFSEVNQPAVHAKEMVNFGLAAISAIQELNREVNQTLRIRVGVNTGGPIVAGVLGIGKPTFEILGPAINMAQQMEHHGVPMNVHISRAVYELVYGDAFNIKERGAVQINTGEVITYLVNPRD